MTSRVWSGAPGLQGQLDTRLADVEGHRLADMLERDQVRARARDRAQQLGQPAGLIRHAREDPHPPALLGFAPPQQPGEQAAVDVPTGDARRLSCPRTGRQAAAEQQRHRHRARTLDDQLRVLGEEDHRVGDLVLPHRLKVVEQLPQQGQRERAGALDRYPVGDRGRARGIAGRAPVRAARPHRGRTRSPARR